MSVTLIAVVAVGLLLVIGILLLVWYRQIQSTTAGEQEMPESLEALKDARIDPGEKVASPISEEIESLVQEELSKHPDLAGRKIDFATLPDESLGIWVDGVAYHGVSDIPDERIRKAVQLAVDDFNKPRDESES